MCVTSLSASCSCDARIGGFWQNGLLIASSPFSQHPLMFAPVNLSLLQFTQDIKAYIDSFTGKYVKFTIIWCLKSPMALKGLKCQG